jgi:hypothetical protein
MFNADRPSKVLAIAAPLLVGLVIAAFAALILKYL